MGFIRKLTGAQAAKDAGRIQAQAGKESMNLLREQMGIATERLNPFVEGATTAIDQLKQASTIKGQNANLAQDPLYQEIRGFERTATAPDLDVSSVTGFDPTMDNPIFDDALDEAEKRLTERNASLGRFDSGNTRTDLVKSLALTRNTLADSEFRRRLGAAGLDTTVKLQDFDNDVLMDSLRFEDVLTKAKARSGITLDRFNQQSLLAQIGANAAGGQANLGAQLGSQLSNITQGVGNARAAAAVASGNANRIFLMDLLKLGAGGGATLPNISTRTAASGSVPVVESTPTYVRG